MSKLLTEVDVI